jgi:phage repressor protein C with HTH and peptisase S24 domain
VELRLGRAVVGGHSMSPALEHGDHLLYVSRRARVGNVVIARDPRDADRWIVKRVASVGDDHVVLASDLPRHERIAVTPAAIVGRAVLRYRPLSRFRLL